VGEATGEKVSQFFHHMTTFLVGLIIGFVRGWQLTLVIIAVTPLLAVAGGVMAAVMGSATTQGQEFYGKAGAVANEAITSVRTVAAFGNQEFEVERYSKLLAQAMDSGIRKNFLSGIMLGMTMLVFFGSYGLALW
jgi:ABC-type multidrug transport system fused ATPase/permease subunit